MQLLFVAPLVENNKGDVDENPNMKPYGYDVIYLDPVDDETYSMVKKAYLRNNVTLLGVLYKASFITFLVMLAIELYTFIFTMIVYMSSGFAAALLAGFQTTNALLAGLLLSLPLLVLMSIKYKKYKGE